jgi:hypothetical protein
MNANSTNHESNSGERDPLSWGFRNRSGSASGTRLRSVGQPAGEKSVDDAVNSLRGRFEYMEKKLAQANNEIAQLNEELSRYRTHGRPARVQVSDFGWLRRRIAHFLHPDRGGDNELMARLNALLDYVEGQQGAVMVKAA